MQSVQMAIKYCCDVGEIVSSQCWCDRIAGFVMKLTTTKMNTIMEY